MSAYADSPRRSTRFMGTPSPQKSFVAKIEFPPDTPSPRKRGRENSSDEEEEEDYATPHRARRTPSSSPTKRGRVSSPKKKPTGQDSDYEAGSSDFEPSAKAIKRPSSSPTKRGRTSSPKKKRANASSPKKRVNVASPSVNRKPTAMQKPLLVPHPTPERWEETFAVIQEMRSGLVAPVDTMGCDLAHLPETDPKNQRFSTLISLMLSSRTKDKHCDAAVARLRKAVGGTLSVAALNAADESTVAEAIRIVGMWEDKVRYIKSVAQILRDEFDSDVPKTIHDLLCLPGVGPKMTFLTLQVAWKLNLGICVDVHVHRITNRLGWHTTPDKGEDKTRAILESWLPKEHWQEINHLLVGFGQTVCSASKPKCGECKLNAGLCPSAFLDTPAVKVETKKVGMKMGPKLEMELES